MARPLGRIPPKDFEHVAKYPLSAAPPALPAPIAVGIDWHSNFDDPVQDSRGKWWVGRSALGPVRGGHCVCLLPGGVLDPTSWWQWYDQGHEGACVGFGCSRMMSLLNRHRYDARWLWNEAKKIDEWPSTNPGDDNGTSVRAGLDVLRTQGHRRVINGKSRPVDALEGIAANRWTTSLDEILVALGTPELDYVEFLNSWGRNGYPHRTRMPATVLQGLLNNDGEAGLVTDL